VKNRTVNIALVGVALILFVMGYDALHSAASNISRLMTGAPTDSSVWLLICSALAAITAAFGFSADRSDSNHSRQ
jgi:divalent metal cation (Fe/Co/Zn/Cd) transporter